MRGSCGGGMPAWSSRDYVGEDRKGRDLLLVLAPEELPVVERVMKRI